ncbi:hypothetical protein C6496_21210 [Candidatus Poribacteria bacterium]|nr:MAG: hypothetical protein C6496_21210 [Candidatus Poribacteria bacterium]
MILKPRYVGWLSPIVFVLLILIANSIAEASPESMEILKRIMNAEEKVAYVGTRMIVMNTSRGTVAREEAVIHQPPEIHAVTVLPILEHDRSLKPSDQELHRGSERDRRNGRRDERRGDRRRFSLNWKRMASLSQKEVELLAQNYTFDSVPADPIAGQETDLVTVSPRFDARPTKRLYLARDTGVILRIEDFAPDGKLRFMSVYTQISFEEEAVAQKLAEWNRNEKPPAEKRRRRSQPITLDEAKTVLEGKLIEPTYLPSGFQLLETRYFKHRSETVYLRYTDGMLTFTVFESKRKQGNSRNSERGGVEHLQIQGIEARHEKRGPTHILQWYISDLNFTVMGELRQDELIKVAESLILAAK